MTDNKYFIFGKSLASVQLARELMTAPKKTREKVSTHIITFCRGLRSINHIPDSSTRRSMAHLWMINSINHLLEIENAPDFNYETTMKNVIKYRYRMWLEHNGGFNKREQANRKTKNARESIKAKKWIAENLP